MTPELLQRAAKCAPEWMGAEYSEIGHVPACVFHGVQHRNPLELETPLTSILWNVGDDLPNTEACYAMREAFRREGRPMRLHEDSKAFWFSDVTGETLGRGENETLAHVNAFLKVFEK